MKRESVRSWASNFFLRAKSPEKLNFFSLRTQSSGKRATQKIKRAEIYAKFVAPAHAPHRKEAASFFALPIKLIRA